MNNYAGKFQILKTLEGTGSVRSESTAPISSSASLLSTGGYSQVGDFPNVIVHLVVILSSRLY